MQSILKRVFPREQLPNISIMGLDAGGKTTLLYKLKTSEVEHTIPTIGFNIETATIQVPASIRVGKKQRFTARGADAGGCGKIYPFVRLTMLDDTVSAIIWVVDAHDTDQLASSVEELEILLHGVGGLKRDNVAPLIPIMVLANKVDLLPNGPTPDIRAKFAELLQGRCFAYFETNFTASQLSSSGLMEAFAWLSDAIGSPEAETPNIAKPDTQKKPVEVMLADIRTPAALSAKLESWLSRAESDPVTAEELLRQFYALDLPSWDHYIHLRLAYTLLLKHGRKLGKDKIFDGFKDYIDKSGKVHGKTFHMTMTYFWVQMVHLGIASMHLPEYQRESHTLKAADMEEQDANPSMVDNFARFLIVNPYLADGQLWADYYSKEVLMSPEAKEGVRFPDIKKLPDVLFPKATENKNSMSVSSTAL